jgi:diguanylate cyclase (GGDEF)-like protein
VILAASVIAALAGISGARKAKGGFRSKSATTYTRGAVIMAIGFGAGIALENETVFLCVPAFGLLFVALGLFIQTKEAEVFLKIASEQRVDFISGLPNERLFYERLAAEHSRTKRTNQRYSIATFEIDEYHLLSDDDKLGGMKLLAESLNESIRNTDSLGRIGEYQVAVLLVDTLAEGAIIGCDRACERFFFQSCGHSDTAHVTRPLTVSVGIAAFDEDTVDPHHVVDNSKLALKRLHDEMDSGIKVYERGEFMRQTDEQAEALDAA